MRKWILSCYKIDIGIHFGLFQNVSYNRLLYVSDSVDKDLTRVTISNHRLPSKIWTQVKRYSLTFAAYMLTCITRIHYIIVSIMHWSDDMDFIF